MGVVSVCPCTGVLLSVSLSCYYALLLNSLSVSVCPITRVFSLLFVYLHHITLTTPHSSPFLRTYVQVPDYKDDFPDWEVDSWLSSFSSPYVPTFLAFGVIILIALLALAAVVMARRKKDYKGIPGESNSPLWL